MLKRSLRVAMVRGKVRQKTYFWKVREKSLNLVQVREKQEYCKKSGKFNLGQGKSEFCKISNEAAKNVIFIQTISNTQINNKH